MLVQERKAQLRRSERHRWGRSATKEELARRSLSVQEHFLSAFPPYRGARIALYKATGGEVDTGLIHARYEAAGALPYYPRVVDGMRLSFYLVEAEDGWVRGRYGLLEPRVAPGTEGRTEGFDLVVVPGMAFDEKGRRLGKGSGYYDRFLFGIAGTAVTVGLAYSSQMVPEVPVDAWDVPVGVVVTENGVIRVSG